MINGKALIIGVVVIISFIPMVHAGTHSDAVLAADRINTAIQAQSLPYDRTLTMSNLAALGYDTANMTRPGTYRVYIKSASYNSTTGLLSLNMYAWHNGTQLKTHSPWHFYMPMSITGTTNTQRLNTFINILIRNLELIPYGDPIGDDSATIYPTMDGYVRRDVSAGDTYSNLRNSATGTSTGTTDTYIGPYLDSDADTNEFDYLTRGVLSFNTSVVGDGADVTNVTLYTYRAANLTNLGDPTIGITGGALASNTSLANGDYDGFTATLLSDTLVKNSEYSVPSNVKNFTFNTDGITNVESNTGTDEFTVIFFRDSWDIDNSFSGSWGGDVATYLRIDSVDHATVSFRPYLYIEYTPGVSAPVAAFSGNVTSGYPSFSVLFTDASTNTPTDWDWYWNGDAVKDSDSQNPTATYNAVIGNSITTYDVNLYAANAAGGDWENKSAYVTAYPLLANYSMDVTSGCAPLTVTFTDTTTNGTPTTWAWNFAGLDTNSSQNTSYTFTTPGVYWVSLNASNTYSWDIENKTTAVNVTGAVPVAAFSANDTGGCDPLDVAFTDSSTGTPTNWTWDFDNDGNADSYDQNPTFQFTPDGTYTVNLTVTNSCGSDSEVKSNYITVSDGAVSADFSVDEGAPTVGETVTFTDLSTGTPTTWQWSFDDGGPNATTQNPTHSWASAGTYTITLTATNGCNVSDTEEKVDFIVVTEVPPTPPITPVPITSTAEGHIPPLGFAVLACADVGLILYGFIDNQNRNYLHVFAFGISMLLAFILAVFIMNGFVAEAHVLSDTEEVVNNSTLSTYDVQYMQVTDMGWSWFFTFIGIMMLILTILAAIEAAREMAYGGNE